MKYVVYEVWTKSRLVDAESESEAYEVGEPTPIPGLNLCNWHIHPVPTYDYGEDDGA